MSFETDAPEIVVEPIEHCPVCKSGRFSRYAEGYDYEIHTCSNLWKFVLCDECSHVWLNPRPAVSTLGTIYPPSYYAYNYASAINPIALRAKGWLDRQKFRRILSKLDRPPRSYLDVGCGDGRFLKLLEGMGLPRENLYGLELDARSVAPLAEAGYKVFHERVEDCRKIPDESIDLVTMFHVIEHVDDPVSVVAKVASWLAPGGIFAIETPNIESWDARLFRDHYWGGYHIPRHWNLFQPSTLNRILGAHGLEPISTHFETGHSFWLYSLHHRLRYGTNPKPALARWLRPIGGGLLPLVAVTALDKLRAAVGCKTSAMLVIARKP